MFEVIFCTFLLIIMQRYIKFFETFYRTDDWHTYVDRKLKVGDIIPLWFFNRNKFIMCKIVDVRQITNDEFINLKKDNVDYIVEFTPVQRSKTIYKDVVFKDGQVGWDMKQVTTSSTYDNTKEKRFFKKYYSESLSPSERENLSKELDELQNKVKKAPFYRSKRYKKNR